MRLAKTWLLCFSFAVVFATPSLHAQEATPNPAAVLLEYEAEQKSAWSAGVLEYMIPLVGYNYAGNWRRGIWPAALYAAGLLMFVPCGFQDDVEACTDSELDRALAGFAVIGISRVWGAIGAARTARDHNRELRERLLLELKPRQGGADVGIRVVLN